MNSDFKTVDEYIKTFPKDIQTVLEQVRATIKLTAPEAVESIAYQMPGVRLYQLGTRNIKEGKEQRSGHTPAPMAPAMQQEFPEIESTTRLIDAFQDDKTLLQYKEGRDV